MSPKVKNMIHNNQLPAINALNLNLDKDEICHYADYGYTFRDKTGYTGKNNGISIRIAKVLSYKVGGSEGQAIRENERTTYRGILYLTNKRIIFSSAKDSFDKTLDKITSIIEAKDGLIIQIGSTSYSIVIDTHREFMKVYNIIKNGVN